MSPTRHYPRTALQVDLDAHHQVEWHDHDHHQLLYPRSGAVSVTTTAGAWVVPPLRAMWLPAEQPHEHRTHGPTKLCSLLLAHPAPRLTEPTLVKVTPLLRAVLLALTGQEGIPLDRDQRHHLEAIVHAQLRPAAEMTCYLPEPRDDRLQAIAAILRDRPDDERDLTELGREVGASARTLSRLYRAETDMSFPQWRTRLRMQLACVQLAESRQVATVAHRCGYSTVSAFTQAFRRHTGMTPARYRNDATEST